MRTFSVFTKNGQSTLVVCLLSQTIEARHQICVVKSKTSLSFLILLSPIALKMVIKLEFSFPSINQNRAA